MILAFITSRVGGDRLASDVVLHDTDTDFPATGLRVSSTVRLHRLMTASTEVILREIGQLPHERMRSVEEHLRDLFRL